MILIRLAFFTFDKNFEKWKNFSFDAGNIHLGTFPEFDSEKYKRLLVVASKKLDCHPEIDDSGLLIVPEDLTLPLKTEPLQS